MTSLFKILRELNEVYCVTNNTLPITVSIYDNITDIILEFDGNIEGNKITKLEQVLNNNNVDLQDFYVYYRMNNNRSKLYLKLKVKTESLS